jgi:hypothetical protein
LILTNSTGLARGRFFWSASISPPVVVFCRLFPIFPVERKRPSLRRVAWEASGLGLPRASIFMIQEHNLRSERKIRESQSYSCVYLSFADLLRAANDGSERG